MSVLFTERDILEQIILPALQEEARELENPDGGRPDRADLRIAAAFDKLAENIRDRLKGDL